MVIDDKYGSRSHKVTGIRHLTSSTFVLRLTREGMQFRAGQHLIAGLHGEIDQREYSIYSGENDDFLEILVREVKDGNISAKLKQCKPGDLLNINGPFGTFGIPSHERKNRKIIFIATGTGISPFHSMIKSFPDLDYNLIHGVSFRNEAYESDEYPAERYFLCTSRETSFGRKGRVTGFLKNFKVVPGMLFFLCGNSSMIYEAGHILLDKGVKNERIFTEVYF